MGFWKNFKTFIHPKEKCLRCRWSTIDILYWVCSHPDSNRARFFDRPNMLKKCPKHNKQKPQG